MTVDAPDVGVRARLVRDEFRPHRRVADLSAERDRIHILDAPVRRERYDDDVRDGEGKDEDGPEPLRRIVQIDRRPGDSRWWPASRATTALEPRTKRNEQEPEHEYRGQQQK